MLKGRKVGKIYTTSIEEVRVVGEFAPQGTNPPTITFPTKRPRFTVARTSQGLWTVTLLDKFFEWRLAHARLSLAAAATRELQQQTFSMAAGTVGIANIDAANTAQDVAANALNTVFFEIVGITSGA